MTTPLVSILIPCYNAAPYVGAAVASVLNQTLHDLEVIIVDDGSTDGSADVLASYNNPRVTCFRQRNTGASAARNRALRKAKAKYCLFLDADDYLEPAYLITQVAAIEAGHADLCFGRSRLTWPDGRTIDKRPMPPEASIDAALASVLADGWYPPNAILWRTGFCIEIGGWNEAFTRNDDGELIARALLAEGVRLTSAAGACAVYRQHHGAGRISARTDRAAVESNVLILEHLQLAICRRKDLKLALNSIVRQAHELASEAYFLGYDDLGARAEALMQTGFRRASAGTTLHKLGERILGIRGKAYLSRRVAAIRSGVKGASSSFRRIRSNSDE